jgi:glycine cleavage system aminomethyltransferase T
MAWPNREFTTGRGLRKSPLHERLAAHGASFGAKNGWERPNWFARGGMKPVVEYSFGRQNWFDCHAAEHRACREKVAVFDQTGFSKLLIKGSDVVSVLQRLCGNDVDMLVGRIIYTGMFNQQGGFESDLTIVRTGLFEFYLITGTAQTIRDLDWINRHIRPDEHAEIIDVTSGWSVIGLMGPQSRALLSRLTDADLSNAAFPFATAQNIALAQASVRSLRITYVGELGWELHVPTEQATLVYDALMEAGQEFGIANAGHYAINSLRLEKGYRAWGADISPDDTALEAGLGFALAWNKSIPFIGREGLLKQKQTGVKRQLVIFTLKDPEPMLWGGEPIHRDGKTVGYTTSGSYAHSLGAAIAMGYVNHSEGVNAEFIKAGNYEISINGRRYAAMPHLRAPYDPERARILL